MSSIMRARSGLMGRGEVSEVIGGSSPELKVAGPSMLGIGCPDRHALPRITLSKMRRPRRVLPSRASGFVHRPIPDLAAVAPQREVRPIPAIHRGDQDRLDRVEFCHLILERIHAYRLKRIRLRDNRLLRATGRHSRAQMLRSCSLME